MAGAWEVKSVIEWLSLHNSDFTFYSVCICLSFMNGNSIVWMHSCSLEAALPSGHLHLQPCLCWVNEVLIMFGLQNEPLTMPSIIIVFFKDSSYVVDARVWKPAGQPKSTTLEPFSLHKTAWISSLWVTHVRMYVIDSLSLCPYLYVHTYFIVNTF